MKKIFFGLAVSIAAVSLIVACNKSNSAGGNGTTTDGTTTTQLQTQTDDETQVSTELDAATNDVNNTLNSVAALSGGTTTGFTGGVVVDGGNSGIVSNGSTGGVITDGGSGSSVVAIDGICDARVTIDTANGLRVITITYNGNDCWVGHRRVRSGKVVITIPVGVRWKDAGAVVTVSFVNLRVIRTRDHKTITLNGTYTYTNVTGGLLKDLPTLGTITHTIAADSVTIRFADSATRIWSVAKQRVFTYNDGIVVTTTGTHSDGTNNDVSVWGTNRYGNSFERMIVQPMVIAQSCDDRLTSGETETIRPAVTFTITYGLDVNGNPTTCPGSGYYYYKLVWTKNGKTYTFIAPY
ncbi:MAG TPA: hypothetical protein VGQ51_02185 [Puia sp.]|nr:hypothetical protein [Puia sp.]